jgi:hypothetical protein
VFREKLPEEHAIAFEWVVLGDERAEEVARELTEMGYVATHGRPINAVTVRAWVSRTLAKFREEFAR